MNIKQKDRKKIFVFTGIIALALLIVGAIAFSDGITGISGRTEQEELILNNIEKRENAPQYIAQGDMTLSLEAMGMKEEIPGEFTTYETSGGEKMRTDMIMSAPQGMDQDIQYQETMETSTFVLPDGTFSCVKEMDEWMCQEGEQAAAGTEIAPEEDEMKELIEKGALEFIGNIEEKEIMGRNCKQVEMKIDVSKMEDDEMEGVEEAVINMKNCYDTETGIPLIENLGFEVPGESLSIEMKIDSLELGAEMPEDIFDLPAEPEPMAQMPMY